MKPEATLYLAKSVALLEEARIVIAAGLPLAAGRSAYLVGFHAAQAFLFETTGKVFKTHKGVQGEFARLTKGDPRFDAEARAFLGSTYELKSIADYGTSPGLNVSPAQASEAIAAAQKYVAQIAAALDEEQQ